MYYIARSQVDVYAQSIHILHNLFECHEGAHVESIEPDLCSLSLIISSYFSAMSCHCCFPISSLRMFDVLCVVMRNQFSGRFTAVQP